MKLFRVHTIAAGGSKGTIYILADDIQEASAEAQRVTSDGGQRAVSINEMVMPGSAISLDRIPSAIPNIA